MFDYSSYYKINKNIIYFIMICFITKNRNMTYNFSMSPCKNFVPLSLISHQV
jgi:hypothetical protein